MWAFLPTEALYWMPAFAGMTKVLWLLRRNLAAYNLLGIGVGGAQDAQEAAQRA